MPETNNNGNESSKEYAFDLPDDYIEHYDEFRSTLIWYINVRIKGINPLTADELFTDIITYIHQRMQSGEVEDISLGGYYRTVADSRIVNFTERAYYREQLSWADIRIDDEKQTEYLFAQGGDTRRPTETGSEKTGVSTDIQNILYKMNETNPEYAYLLRLNYFEEMPTSMMAEELGISESALKGKLVRARKMFRKIMEEDNYKLHD